MIKQNCHCGSLIPFNNCCETLINRETNARTAEQLMRSRFSAFKIQNYQYLIDTHLIEEGCKPIQLKDFDPQIDWLGLYVINHINIKTQPNKAEVEFAAFYQDRHTSESQNYYQLHENSFFKKVESQWFYVKGKHLPNLKIERNQPCFCQSGKKFKKCHA